MIRWLLLTISVSILPLCHAQAPPQCAGSQLTIQLVCEGPDCQSYYSPGTPTGAGEALYTTSQTQCCGHNVTIWRDTGNCCPTYPDCENFRSAAMRAAANAGIHLLVSTCTGNLLPFNEKGAALLTEWRVPDIPEERSLFTLPKLEPLGQ
jgi:hypothetical protein